MNNTTELTQQFQQLVTKLEVTINKVAWTTIESSKILQIEIKRPGGVDLDLCGEVSTIISEYLDTIDQNWENYLLEVCSAGIEEVITSQDQLNEHLNDYLLVKFHHPIKGMTEVKGTLMMIEDQYLIECFVKGMKKKVQFNYNDISFAQLSVKI